MKQKIEKAIKELQRLDSAVFGTDRDGSLVWINDKILEVIGLLSQNKLTTGGQNGK